MEITALRNTVSNGVTLFSNMNLTNYSLQRRLTLQAIKRCPLL